jgi:hypothetical protein
MIQITESTRRFKVHAPHAGSHHTRIVDENSFEAAAVAYFERFAWDAEEDHAISVVVREDATGHERCFRIDLESGETEPCD